jgi:hypothetical protein
MSAAVCPYLPFVLCRKMRALRTCIRANIVEAWTLMARKVKTGQSGEGYSTPL